MAEKENRFPENASGTFYVDDQCIDCDACREVAPEIFQRNEDEGYTYIGKQPTDSDGEDLVRKAMDECPVEAIGDDG